MKLTNLFTKTSKDVPSDETSRNAQLLMKAGFISKSESGVYSFLPLGLRVLNKVENIVRKNMDAIGGQEVLMSTLMSEANLKKTERWEVDVKYQTEGNNGSSYSLAFSNEEVVTPIASTFINSWKDLPETDIDNEVWPLSVYHINTKYRNELRAKAGILRGREFRMKDLYDFHRTKESQQAYYDLMIDVYNKTFEDMGLKSYAVEASGGIFSDKPSHEFQVVCEAGEDITLITEDGKYAYNQEVAPSKIGVANEQQEMKPLEDLHKAGITGMEELVKELGVTHRQCTKTLFYTDENNGFIVAVVRGDYDINEEKLQKIHGSKELRLATKEQVMTVTGAEIGYAGLYNLLSEGVTAVYVDDSTEGMTNWECGSNQTDHHAVNVNWGRDVEIPKQFYDIKMATEGDIHPESGQKYQALVTSEVGNIYDCGTKYTEAFKTQYTDENNKPQTVYMGCHGIGTTRCVGVIADVFNDDRGLKWPTAVAPYQYHLVSFYGSKDDENVVQQVKELSKKFYTDNEGKVLWDDRNDKKLGMGQKLGDADLIGCPTQIIISSRNIAEGLVEVKDRQTGETRKVKIEELGNI